MARRSAVGPPATTVFDPRGGSVGARELSPLLTRGASGLFCRVSRVAPGRGPPPAGCVGYDPGGSIMATSWLTRWYTYTVRPVRRPVRTKARPGWFRPKVEALAERVLPAVTAIFSAAAGQLRIVGDDQDNTVVVSR